MINGLVGHYDLGLVGLSLGIAMLASHTTLSLGDHILAAVPRPLLGIAPQG